MSTKKVVLFNHKGGVSKTTTTFHIGGCLPKWGIRFYWLMVIHNVI